MAESFFGLDLNKLRNELTGGKDIFTKLYDSASSLNVAATSVNKTLLLNRERILEISQVIADSAPEVARFGGDIRDVTQAITSVAEASRRAVILAADDISKLYVASKVLGDVNLEKLSSNFIEAGIQVSNISKNIEESINYVQSIGGNAKMVMDDVVNRMEYMNRFNFQDGVMGFTRMAAKASMLRLDMRDVASFAEDIMNPQGAIEVASAFQRLGVAAGTLVDPFSLMYKSINDPEGLQDSIIELGKRFVDFNSETGNFKINPAGIMQMKELSGVLKMSYNDFAKMAISAADFDKRLSEISFDYKGNREDLMLLANMAQFKGGEYVVKIDEKEKRLRDVTEEEFVKLREIQENAPKTLEEIAKGQMTLTENIAADVKAIAYKILYGITSTPEVVGLTESIRRIENTLGSSVYQTVPGTEEIRGIASEMFGFGSDVLSGIKKGITGNLTDKEISDIESRGDKLIDTMENTLKMSMTRGYDTAMAGLKKGGALEMEVYEVMKNNRKYIEDLGVIFGDKSKEVEGAIKETTIKGNYDLNFNGEIKHKIDAPFGVNNDDVKRLINKTFEGDKFKEKIFEILNDYNSERRNPTK